MKIRAVAPMLLGALCSIGRAYTQGAPPVPALPAVSAPASIALPPLDLTSGYVVPFRYDPPTMPFMVVQARVNGQGPYPFMVDTGFSAAVVISKDFVPLFKLRSNGDRARLNETVKTQGVTVKKVEIQTNKANAPFTVNLVEGASTAFVVDFAFMRDTYAGPPIAGVIGAPVLAAMTERIDFARHELTFYTQAHAPLQVSGTTRLLVRGKDDRYFVEVGAQDDATTPLLVDTGALLTTLPFSFRSHLHPDATILNGSATIGSYTIGSRWLLPTLRLGPLVEPDVATSACEEEQGGLGLNVLTRFTLYLDFLNGQMLVQRAPDYEGRRRLQGWTGIHLDQNDVVDVVRPPSPAYRAGVRMGDRLLTIGGRPVAGTSAYLLQQSLDGTAGTPLTLTIARGNAPPQTVVVPRAREFDVTPSALAGMMLYKADKPYISVQDVAPGSLADKAGLRAGERILKINGKAAKTLTWQDMWEVVQVSPVQLQVTDAQGKHARDIILTLP